MKNGWMFHRYVRLPEGKASLLKHYVDYVLPEVSIDDIMN
jgi:hypothetical protein